MVTWNTLYVYIHECCVIFRYHITDFRDQNRWKPSFARIFLPCPSPPSTSSYSYPSERFLYWGSQDDDNNNYRPVGDFAFIWSRDLIVFWQYNPITMNTHTILCTVVHSLFHIIQVFNQIWSIWIQVKLKLTFLAFDFGINWKMFSVRPNAEQ